MTTDTVVDPLESLARLGAQRGGKLARQLIADGRNRICMRRAIWKNI